VSHTSLTCLWRWNRQWVPKRRQLELRRQGITQIGTNYKNNLCFGITALLDRITYNIYMNKWLFLSHYLKSESMGQGKTRSVGIIHILYFWVHYLYANTSFTVSLLKWEILKVIVFCKNYSLLTWKGKVQQYLNTKKSVCCNYDANFKLTEMKHKEETKIFTKMWKFDAVENKAWHYKNLTLWRTRHDTTEIKKPLSDRTNELKNHKLQGH